MITDCCGWSALAGETRQLSELRQLQVADIAIVGAGFTGLAAARRYAELRPESRVLLIDAKSIGQGASARNSGFAVANESPGHSQLQTAQGLASYQTMNRLDHAGVSELRRLIEAHDLPCQWEDTGSIHAAHDPRNFDKLHHHVATFQKMGVDARLLEADSLRDRLGTGFYKLGVESRGGALLQPAMLVKGLLENLPPNVECFENTPVQCVDRTNNGWTLSLPNGSVQADQVIVAVNAFFPRLGFKSMRVFPLALTASLTRPLTAQEESEINHAPSWGILSPQSLGATMRLTKDRRILIRNTGEYRPSGISPALLAERKKQHVAGLKRRFKFIDESAIAYSWSGTICISRNSKPVFEESAPGLFLCGGYNASGVSRGTIMGRLVSDLALGKPSSLLNDALSLKKPNLIPPRPFFDLMAKGKLHFERSAALTER
ncbi:MAG: FAD-binding oxidoreductase [Paracoccaceae bacterium]